MNWTVSRRIAVGFTAVLVLALLLAVASVLALRGTVEAFNQSLAQEQAIEEIAMEAESQSLEANLQYLRYFLEPAPQFIEARDSSAENSRQLIERARAASEEGEERQAWDEALEAFNRWDRLSATSMNTLRAGNRAEAIESWTRDVLPAREEVRSAIDAGVAAALDRGQGMRSAARATADRMERRLWLVSFLVVALGLLAGWLLNRAVSDPLRETSGVLASSAAEILAASTQQASSASETSAAVAQTSTTVDEVAETSKHATERARSVSDTAKRAAEIGKSGRKAVDETVAAMSEVQEQVETIAQSIVALAEQAQAIGDIITTVNEVAEQTNLLALNAAVEAARAGEHGRGFAVVAGEVRALAEQSKRATVQVRQILGEIQSATNAVVMTTERGSHQVAAGTRQVNEAGDTIRALADAAAEAAQAAAQIVASAGEQSVGMDQIRLAMGNVQEATQQTLASTRQAESAAQDLNQLGERLLNLVGRDGLRLPGTRRSE